MRPFSFYEELSSEDKGRRSEVRNAWRIRRLGLLLTIILGSGHLLGCAFVDRRVTLTPPTTIPQTFSASTSSSDKKEISVARPQDLRPDPTTVGNIRNGYGMVTASVRSNTDIPMWVTNSVIQGLERAGFRVERAETVETAPTPVALDIACFTCLLRTRSRIFHDESKRRRGRASRSL